MEQEHGNKRVKTESPSNGSIQDRQQRHLILDDTSVRVDEPFIYDDAIEGGEFSASEILETVEILDSSRIHRIGDGAFDHCTSLQSVHLADSVTEIGWRAFRNCLSLQSIRIPSGVTDIGVAAFYGCTSLQSVHISNGVTTIGAEAFWCCSSLQSLHIPTSVRTIGEYAFGGCSSLPSLIIPNGVASIEEGAFCHCTALPLIHISSTVAHIKISAFEGCSSLKVIYIPNSVTEIGAKAFLNCDKLDQRQTNGTNYHPDTVTWLRQRFDNLPIHRACYDAYDAQSAVDLLPILIQENDRAFLAAATDAMGMTPFDILCCNLCVTPVKMVQLLADNNRMLGLSPFMLAASLPGCGLDVVFVTAMNDLDIILR